MKIEIIVATYNRQEDINNLFLNLQNQTLKEYHVTIVDDNSSEEISLPFNDERFSVIRLQDNWGQAKARNVALKQRISDIIVLLDDDSYFLNEDALGNLAGYFEEEKVGCVQFNVAEPDRKSLAERRNLQDKNIVGEFIACGCAFRTSVLKKIGGFNENFHSYGEETEMSLRILDLNYEIVFSDKVKVFHNYKPSERTWVWHKRFIKNSTRNDLANVVLNYPSVYVMPYILGKFLSRLKFAVLGNGRKPFSAISFTIIGFYEFVLNLFVYLKARKGISKSTFQLYLKTRFK